MKRIIPLLALVAFPHFGVAKDFDIKVVRRQGNASGVKDAGFQKTKSDETFYYDVTVANTGFKPSPAVKAQYVIFVDREELGKKQGTEKADRVVGNSAVEELKPHSKTSFQTNTVTLRDQSLSGGYIYLNGGKIRAKDSLAGLWIKLFDAENQLVGEYVNPTNLASRHQWDVVSVAKGGKGKK